MVGIQGELWPLKSEAVGKYSGGNFKPRFDQKC